MTAADGGTPPPRERDVDAATLLGDDHEAFERFLAGEEPGPLAVVGAPYAGRATVLDAAADRLGADRRTLDPGDGLAMPGADDGPLVVGGCQHLYERRVGGFDRFDPVLDALPGAGARVVTGWNRYAWAYLSAVRNVDREFPTVVEVGPVATERIAELVLARYDDLPTFVSDETVDTGLLTFGRRSVGLGGRSVSVPVPRLNAGRLPGVGPDGDPDPRDVVFERLGAVSGGNVGVATAIWESWAGTELRPGDVVASGGELDIDRDEAFCLRLVLANERIERRHLARAVGDRVDRVVGRLAREGLVADEGEVVSLEPAAVPAAAAATDRERIL